MHQPKSQYSRRGFLAAGLAASAAMAQNSPSDPGSRTGPSTLVDVDYRTLISRADLVLSKPVSRSEAGIPVGNGRMGSLLWTSPATLHLEINRADVYANNSYTTSFFERNTTYCGGCSYVDVDFSGWGADVFPDSGFSQRLSVYDGVASLNGNGVSIRALAWHQKDVMALQVDDSRRDAGPVTLSLRMLRYEQQNFGRQSDTLTREHKVAVRTFNHLATSQLHIEGDRIALTQEFHEGEYTQKTAVVAAIAGRKAKPTFANELEVRLAVEPGAGTYTLLVASAASFDANEDVLAAARAQLDAAAAAGFGALASDNENWWHDFWRRGFIHLHSADGDADYVEQNYHYYLYLMGASSRGLYPPKFNGMIWSSDGDLRTWGAQHWFANLSCYYEGIPASHRLELLDPVFHMYSGMYDASVVAARQQWASQGMFIGETSWFDGLPKLPDDIAREMQELYLLRKPWNQRSERFREFSTCQHPLSSRWNWWGPGQWIHGRWVPQERDTAPFGPVNHNLGTTSKIAYLYWQKYEYTLDQDWLRDRAYPMLKGAAELYRNFPNVKKEADGLYHIHNVNSNESVLGAQDTDEDLASMRGVFPALLRASEILGLDAAMRPVWKEFLDHLPPLPTTDNPDALKPANYTGPRVFVRGLKPAVRAAAFALPDGNSLPAWFFDLCNLESTDKTTLETANNTFALLARGGANRGVSLLSKVPMAAALLGRSEDVGRLILEQLRGVPPDSDRPSPNLENRMSLREGAGALDAEALGRSSAALELALLQSNPPAPAEDPILHLFPACPNGWDATFTLAARRGFVVTSAIENGRAAFVELSSEAGAECPLRNPWGEGEVTLYRDGKKAESLKGSLLRFATRKGEKIVVAPAGATLDQLKRTVKI